MPLDQRAHDIVVADERTGVGLRRLPRSGGAPGVQEQEHDAARARLPRQREEPLRIAEMFDHHRHDPRLW